MLFSYEYRRKILPTSRHYNRDRFLGENVGFFMKCIPFTPHMVSAERAVIAYRNNPEMSGSFIPITNLLTVESPYGYIKHFPMRTFAILCKSSVGGRKNLQFTHDFTELLVVDARIFHIYAK